MVLKNILLHLDESPYCSARQDLAIAIAKKHQARLTSIDTIQHHELIVNELGVARINQQIQRDFLTKTKAADVHAICLGVDDFNPNLPVTLQLAHESYYYDLILIGQHRPGSSDMNEPNDLAERLIPLVGRPIMVVPYVGSFDSCGEHILVAWSPGRESTRALYDAFPLLRKAQQVTFLNILQPNDSKKVIEKSLTKICQHLGSHGVDSRFEVIVSTDVSPADAILNQLRGEVFDLLVTGACGSDGKVGPVARQVLRQITVPILMSH